MSLKNNNSSSDEIRVVDDEEITSVDEVVRLDAPKLTPIQKKTFGSEERAMAGMMGEEPEENHSSPRPFDPEGEWLIEAEAAEVRSVPIGWFVLLGLGLAGLIVWAGYQKLQTSDNAAQIPVAGAEPMELPVAPSGTTSDDFIAAAEAKDAETHFEAMEKLVSDFLGATTIKERLPHIRHAKRVEPLMQEHYSRKKFETFKFEETIEYNVLSLGNHPFIALKVRIDGNKERSILVEDTPEGMLIDWESYVCYQPVTFAQLLKARPTEPVSLRLYVQQDNYYTYEFDDESKYLCFKLESRGEKESLFGYVERGGLLETKFRKLFPAGMVNGAIYPLILKVRFLPNSRAKKGVLIEELESRLWAYPVNPDLKKKSN